MIETGAITILEPAESPKATDCDACVVRLADLPPDRDTVIINRVLFRRDPPVPDNRGNLWACQTAVAAVRVTYSPSQGTITLEQLMPEWKE